MGTVLTVNIAHEKRHQAASSRVTGIYKVPTAEAVAVRAPGPMQGGLGSGLVGDIICNDKFHGGDDQAVYAYAREDLDAWEARLQRPLASGLFGENLTTSGVEVTDALIGERWEIGDDGLVLEVSAPRIPCQTFATVMGEQGWTKTFTQAGEPGAYLRVISPGTVRCGDRITVVHRPDHTVTVATVFRARTVEPALLPKILVADALSAETKKLAQRRTDG